MSTDKLCNWAGLLTACRSVILPLSFDSPALEVNYTGCRGECAKLRENVPYVKVHRYNPKHLYPKLNGYGDNGERSLKV